ncbi:MAG: PilZ domain-containing protein [Spirochaetales bacterium]|nr:PilZ domain-containing protein [Spirochaetales bacterium]
MERRRYKRVKKDFKVCLIEKQENKINIINLKKAQNVSACGILVDYEESVNVNTIIKIQFLDQNSFVFFESEARVIRVEINPDNQTYSIGIEFINMNKKDRKKLKRYLIEE